MVDMFKGIVEIEDVIEEKKFNQIWSYYYIIFIKKNK
jgi:hypothetical protein